MVICTAEKDKGDISSAYYMICMPHGDKDGAH